VNYKVTFIFTPQPEGGYTVTCKELPGLVTEGDSVDEALANLKDAFAATLELYEDLGRPLPEGIQVPDEEVSIGNMPLQLETVLPGLEPTLSPQ
jgi:antitoxin HicB